MIRAKLPYDTKHFQTYRKEGSVTVFDKAYCVYCGKEIQPDTEIDHHETCDYYHCDCEDAKKEIALQQDIERLDRELRVKKKELFEHRENGVRYTTKTTVEIVKKDEA